MRGTCARFGTTWIMARLAWRLQPHTAHISGLLLISALVTEAAAVPEAQSLAPMQVVVAIARLPSVISPCLAVEDFDCTKFECNRSRHGHAI
mmetsp:Transcript_53065/g.123518  ORF Transcript_53065/g.123518 Transcript_53065/m.123518 type:complete len:92 (+) Transcript_53065:315-590(+)